MGALAGAGAFAQGLVGGYKLADDLKTAEANRNFKEQEAGYYAANTARVKADSERASRIDSAGKELAASIKDMMPGVDGQMPQSGAIADPAQQEAKVGRWMNAYTNYMAIAHPDKLNDLRQSIKAENLTDYARSVAQTASGLMNRDPNAIQSAAKLYGLNSNGLTIDPSRSGYDDKGNVNFTALDAQGNVAKQFTLPQQDIHFLAYKGLFQPDQFLTQYGHAEQRAEQARYHTEEIGVRREANALHAASNAESRADRRQQFALLSQERQDRMGQQDYNTGFAHVEHALKPEYDMLKNPDNVMKPEQRSAGIARLDNITALASQSLNLNRSAGLRVAGPEILNATKSLIDNTGSVQFDPVLDKSGNPVPGIGRLPSGALIQLPATIGNSTLKYKPAR